ncbi:MAG: MG2 domain-containing protein [Phycisphaerales bacterium]
MFKQLRVFLLLVTVLAITGGARGSSSPHALAADGADGNAPATAATATGPELRQLRAAMRARAFADAITLAGTVTQPGEVDEALYLKALAEFETDAFEDAIATARNLVARFPDSRWQRKAGFLSAQAYVQLRNFEAAEAIYEAEALRLLSSTRKEELAAVFVAFGDELSREADPNDPGALPPNYAKAYALYGRALDMEVGRDMRDAILFKQGRMAYLAGMHGDAIRVFHMYLAEFDPAWMGPVDSPERRRGQLREQPPAAGQHIISARYHLGKSQLASAQFRTARVNFEDLDRMLRATPDLVDPLRILADTNWQIVRTYDLPALGGGDSIDAAVKAARAFLAEWPAHLHSIEAAMLIPAALQMHGRADEAIDAYRAFLEGESYGLPEGDERMQPLHRLGKSAVELEAEWQPAALYAIGNIQYAQRRYTDAIATFEQYANRFPNGPAWAESQRMVINAKFMIAIDALASNDEDRARNLLTAFLNEYPLDGRAAQAMFIIGQIDASRGEALLTQPQPDVEGAAAAFTAAIEYWSRLISKYRGSEEAGLALYRTGVIYEEHLGKLEQALKSYRALDWSSWAAVAAQRVARLTEKSLEVTTERSFRTNETPVIRVAVRNIEKLTIRQYQLDPEAYFRKTHTLGGIEALDIALIEPDHSFEVDIADYAKYLPLSQTVEIPLPEGKPGVSVVHVAEDDLEATTLIIRSDIDCLARASRRELLVFVQNILRSESAADVKILISNGQEIIETGLTEDDGVLRAKLDALSSHDDFRIFANADGHVAAATLNLGGADVAAGLDPRGYIFTDRPAYQPGDMVGIKAIIRDVRDSTFAVNEGQQWIVTVHDAAGRQLRHEECTLSKFGTLDLAFTLDDAAAEGAYRVSAVRASNVDDRGPTFSGTFVVQQFQLQKTTLAFDFPQRIFDRGDVIGATLTASYYWGEPVIGRDVQLSLPDGRVLIETTDAEGHIAVSFDTSGMQRGSSLRFEAALLGEDVFAREVVYLPEFGYALSVESAREVALAGEPFDVRVSATDPNGDPVAERTITIAVLQQRPPIVHPVLSQVPWLDLPEKSSEPIILQTLTLETDAAGKGSVQITLEEGDEYTLRATGIDRFEQTVTATTAISISDDEDETRLRIFAEASTLNVGEETAIRLHSRAEQGSLALLTFEGDAILEHRVVRLSEGENTVALAVDHQHYPNFVMNVMMMDGPSLREASHPFKVERELRIELAFAEPAYTPGTEGTLAIIVTDQLGQPVEAELSLSLVDEALYAMFSESFGPIGAFFDNGQHRSADFRAGASNGFAYTARTQRVNRDVQAEGERLVTAGAVLESLEQVEGRLRRLEDALYDGRSELERGREGQPAPQALGGGGGGMGGGGGGGRGGGSGGNIFNELGEDAGSPADASKFYADLPQVQQLNERLAVQGQDAMAIIRKDAASAGWWLPTIITDAEGKATISLALPERTTRWRATARGVSVDTLVGEARTHIITRRDFFVDVKAPRLAFENDDVRIISRVHNLTDFVGNAELTLEVRRGEQVLSRQTRTASIDANAEVEVVFDAMELGNEESATIVITARAGEMVDALERTILIEPWGLPYAVQGGGVATSNAALALQLPGGITYRSRSLTIQIEPTLEQAVIDLALNQPRYHGGRRSYIWQSDGGELLAAVSGLAFAQHAGAREIDRNALRERVRSLVGTLVTTQRDDGGWPRHRGSTSDWNISRVNFWALATAEKQGITVDLNAFNKAQTFLNAQYQSIAAADHFAKAVILHALSERGQADFRLANALYRERNALEPITLAYAALTFANLDRAEFATELLTVLMDRAARTKRTDGTALASFPGTIERHRYLQDDVHTTAVALLAFTRARMQTDLIAQSVAWLLDVRGCDGFITGTSRGPAVTALAAYYMNAQPQANDYELKVIVNDTEVATLAHDGDAASFTLDVPAIALKDGRNSVRFEMEGRGRYAYSATLNGFSADFTNRSTLNYPRITRRYLHDTLRYRETPIKASSTSAVSNIEIGQVVRVDVDFENASHPGYATFEEVIPAGMTLVPGSIKTSQPFEIRGNRVVLFQDPSRRMSDFSYELVGYSTGMFNVLPSVLRDVADPSRIRLAEPATLRVLAPGEKSNDPYEMNDAERFALATLNFNDGRFQEAVGYLWPLFDRDHIYQEAETSRMLLWIHTMPEHFDAARVVKAFEVLSVRHPNLTIPFDRILAVGQAYRQLGEFERAWLVFRATIETSFLRDSSVAAILEDEGQLLGSLDYQEDLWWQYPDLPDVVSSYFALSQVFFEEAPNAAAIARRERAVSVRMPGHASETIINPEELTEPAMIGEAIRLLTRFMTLYPNHPLVDDAAFSLANAWLALDDYDRVIELSAAFRDRYQGSEFTSSFQYMIALGHFWKRNYALALEAARVVADGESRDRDFARYILGQVYHAEGRPEQAIRWYETVDEQYPDAREAIDYFRRQQLSMEEVTQYKPGEAVTLDIDYRNITELNLQVYRVDLMTLYLREKNLSNITQVNLAGIEPQMVATHTLGDGKDYVEKTFATDLDLTDEGAYLVIARGDNLFASGLILISPLAIEVQEDAVSGRVRLNVIDEVAQLRPAGVHVKAIGSADSEFRSGQTDLRGIFVADAINGRVTAIARDDQSRYAFYRGDEWLGQAEQGQTRGRPQEAPSQEASDFDYGGNLRMQNMEMQQQNRGEWDKSRRNNYEGVEIRKAQ